MTHPSPLVITLMGAAPPHHPSTHRLTQCLLNIAFQKVLLDCMSVCVCMCADVCTYKNSFFTRCPRIYVFKRDFCVCMRVCVCMKMCICVFARVCLVSGHFICVFSQSKTRGGICRSPLLSFALVLSLRGIASLIAVEKPHQCQAR